VIQFYSILFICCLFNNATSSERFEASNHTMISESSSFILVLTSVYLLILGVDCYRCT